VTLRVSPLDPSHDLTHFQSGNSELDSWLREHSHQATGHGTRTYVVLDDAGVVVGYFAIVPHLISRVEAPARLARGAPREIPAILLAKLALAERLHGQGLGSEVLVLALRVVLEGARVAGGKLVVVDAIDELAAAYYEHHDFQRLPDRADRLVIKLSTVARALELDWP
jgi:GNAT superfamily N-acetyltransferase